jgi:ubiquinone/menaquinone biosynthesis C-methylase UbiE
MGLRADDTLLDLCCGNGLFASAFSEQVASIHAVDISSVLTERLEARSFCNVHVNTCDMRDVRYPPQSFSKVLWYAGIQYIDDSDIVAMIRRIRFWMKPGGTLMIGDIPDRAKLWLYFNDDVRCSAYFDGLERRKPIIGTWIDADWLERLCLSSGFLEANKAIQHPRLIYADFRYDLIAKT